MRQLATVQCMLSSALTCLVLGLTSAWARPVRVSPTPSVHFIAKGPGGTRIDGVTSDLALAVDGNNLVLSVRLDTLDTGIALRNKHMKETYLEIDKFPTATLTVNLDGLHPPTDGAVHEEHAEGTFALHGVTKTLPFAYSAQLVRGHVSVHAAADLKLGDYSIETPKYLGVGVKPDIGISATFMLEDKP